MNVYSCILSVVGMISTVMPAAAIPYFDCNFEEGMPDGFSLHDSDAQELHFTMVQLGFSQTDSWIVLREEGSDNHYAASASRFKTNKGETASPAEDWMVTAPIWVRASDARLSWRGMSVNDRSSSTSSYKVYISTEGSMPENFSSEPVAVIDREEIRQWTSHEIDLAQYVGERIFIAFVNTSDNSDVLAIDDIAVAGSPGIADLAIIPGEYTLGSEEIVLGGKLTATSDEIVNTLSITFHVDGASYHAEYTGLGLSQGETFEFELPERISAYYGDTIEYSVSSEVNGVKYDDLQLHTTLLAFMPTKRVVVEEATGMWCGYCPEGIAAMEITQQRHPDTFIGVAVHVNDLVTVPGYGDSMSFPSGAPTAWIDRKSYCESPLSSITEAGKHTYTTLKGGLESMFLDRLAQQAFADVDVKAALDPSDRSLSIDITSRFAMKYSDRDFRIALLITEDKVWKQGYYQTNYHSGRDEDIFGFESLPPMILDNFEFNHVARGVYGSYQGIKGSLPADLNPEEDYSYSVNWSLPQDVDPLNAKVIAMIVDASTGEIMNADTASLGDSGVNCTLQDSENAQIEVFDLSGLPVKKTAGNIQTVISSLPTGLFVIRATYGNDTVVKKISVPHR